MKAMYLEKKVKTTYNLE